MTFTEKDKELIMERIIFGKGPYADGLPKGKTQAYASVRFGELSGSAREFLSDTISQSNRLPIDGDVIRINWTDDGGFYFYACNDAGEWYAGSDLNDEVLDEIYKKSIATKIKRLYDIPPETEFYVKNGNWYGCVYLDNDGQKMCHIFNGPDGEDMVLTPKDDGLNLDIIDKKLRSFSYTAWTLIRNGYEKLSEFNYKKTLGDGTEFFVHLPGHFNFISTKCHLSCSDGINKLEKTSVVVDNLKEAEDVLLKAVKFLGEGEERER